MKTLQAQLIRLGKKNPQLRDHLRPVLDYITSSQKTSGKLTKDDLFALSIRYDDPALEELDLSIWDLPDSGKFIHKNGAYVEITGVVGRWVAVDRDGNTLTSRSGRPRYFKKPTTAMKQLK